MKRTLEDKIMSKVSKFMGFMGNSKRWCAVSCWKNRINKFNKGKGE